MVKRRKRGFGQYNYDGYLAKNSFNQLVFINVFQHLKQKKYRKKI